MIGIGIGVNRQRFRGGGGATPLLLDTYTGAAAAYSLRKLRSAYTGNAIRVRRSSDNTELNIGFVGGDLDVLALTTFCSGTDGFVATWYDQSGNTSNVINTTAANQPQIVSSGSVLLRNFKPTIRFDGISQFLSVNNPISGTNVTSFIVYTGLGSPNNTQPYHFGSSTNTGFWSFNTTTLDSFASNNRLAFTLTFNQNQQYLVSQNHNNVTKLFYRNNVLVNSVSDTVNLGLTLFVGRVTSAFSNCDLQELIIYPSNQVPNISNINSNINDGYGIY